MTAVIRRLALAAEARSAPPSDGMEIGRFGEHLNMEMNNHDGKVYESVVNTVRGWLSGNEVSDSTVLTVEKYVRRLRPHQDDGFVSILNLASTVPAIPHSFTDDIANPVAKLLTGFVLSEAKEMLKIDAKDKVVERNAPASSTITGPIKRLFHLYSTRIFPFVLASHQPPSGSAEWTLDDIARIPFTACDQPSLLCALQPLFVGIESLAKGTSFHAESISARTDLSFIRKGRMLFDIIRRQMNSVSSLALLFRPIGAVPLSAELVVVRFYCQQIDGVLNRTLLKTASTDSLGVGVIGVFDAFVSFARDVMDDSLESFVSNETAKGKAARTHTEVPGAGALLTCDHGGIVSRVLDVAMSRCVSILDQQRYSSRTTADGKKEDWRYEHLRDAYSIPLPSPRLAQLGRVATSVIETMDVVGRVVPEGREKDLGQLLATFIVDTLHFLSQRMGDILEDIFENEILSPSKKIEIQFQLHQDVATVIAWGVEWVERLEGHAPALSTQEALDVLYLTRDKLIRSISVLISEIIETYAMDTCADGVVTQCRMLKAVMQPTRALYATQGIWNILRTAAFDRVRKALKSDMFSDDDIAAFVAAVFDE